MDIFGKKRLKEKVNKLKKFQIKETYGVDHFAAFGITCQCRNPVLFMFTLPMVDSLSLSFKPGVALLRLFFPKLLHN